MTAVDWTDDAPDPVTASPLRMPQYIATGLDQHGRCHAEYIRAPTAAEAVEALLARGFTDVRLLTDDTYVTSHDKGNAAEAQQLLRLQELVRMSQAGKYRARLIFLWAIYRKLWVLPAFGIAMLAYERVGGGRLTWIDLFGGLMAAFPGLLVVLIPATGPNLLDRLLRAAVAADWEQVLRLLPRLRKAMEPGEDAELETELWRARALAATGRLDEAMKITDHLRDLSLLPPPLADRRIAAVHYAAQDIAGARDLLERAASSNPDDAAAWIDLAEILAVRFEEPALAAKALARATEIPLSDLTEQVIGYIGGAIAICEGRADDARGHLLIACAALHSIGNPIARAMEYQALALLSIAEARLGDQRSAMRHFGKAEPFLRAHNDQQLLERCHKALGITTPATFIRAR